MYVTRKGPITLLGYQLSCTYKKIDQAHLLVIFMVSAVASGYNCAILFRKYDNSFDNKAHTGWFMGGGSTLFREQNPLFGVLYKEVIFISLCVILEL